MTDEELVEAVAREMCASVEARTSNVNVVRSLGYKSVQEFIDAAWLNYAAEARAAIAVIRPAVLEEAARVADNHGNEDTPDCGGCGEEIAAAIRALRD